MDWFFDCNMPVAFWSLFCIQGSNLWYWPVEPEPYYWLGMGHYQLCVVDRYWSCGNAHFRNSVIIQAGLENRGEQGCRGNDHFRRYMRGNVSYFSYGTGMGRILRNALPKFPGPLWPNFNSALLWDVFAVSTYFTVSLLFWYTGLLPDLATVRDRARTKFRKMFYGLASFGWTGSTKHWQRQESLALVLAGLATPLVLSVHTIVSIDFATSVVPGWHTTIFPPYFVAGAIFSGFAMVQSLLIITRKVLQLEDYITVGHIEAMNKVIVLTGSIVGCAYLTELFIAWYGQNQYEWWAFRQNRVNIFSPYGWAYYGMMFCNVVSPQIFWSRKLRRNVTFTFFMSVLINIGMWFERFVIIVTSIYRDFIPSSWSTYYSPSIWEVGFYLGTFGLFFTCYFLFAKFFPVIAVAEIKAILKTSGENYKKKMTRYRENGCRQILC